MTYKVKLPRDVEIDVFNLPENFKEIVEQTFREYTKGTSDEFRFTDKLSYVDVFISNINGNKFETEIVDEYYKEFVAYRWEEYGEVVKEEDIYDQSFFYECCKRGRENTRLHQFFGINDHHIYYQVQKVLVKVITIVMNYGENEELRNV